MADEYTPTTDHVREVYATYDGDWQPDFAADFDRWLAAHDREIREQVSRDIAYAAESTLNVDEERGIRYAARVALGPHRKEDRRG